MECRRCGAEIPEGSRFCPTCGEPTAEGATAREAVPDAAEAMTGAASRIAHNAVNAAVQGVQAAADRLNEVAGGTGHVDLRFTDFFDEVFKKHGRGEAEELFFCGTPATTPAPADISREWPHPWLYSRVFLVLLAALVGLWVVMAVLDDTRGGAGFALVASLLVNVSMVVFFFETNAPRNVSFPLVLAVFLLGGVLALAVDSPLSRLAVIMGGSGGAQFTQTLGGVVGEAAKVAVLAVLLPRMGRGNYVLTGMLMGAAVGAGYSVFLGVGGGADGGLFLTLASWTVSALGYHAALGAIEGGALMLAGMGQGSSARRGALVPFLAICAVLAALWSCPIDALFQTGAVGAVTGISIPALDNALTLQGALLTVAAWVVIVVLLHRGLAQVNEVDATPNASGEGAAE